MGIENYSGAGASFDEAEGYRYQPPFADAVIRPSAQDVYTEVAETTGVTVDEFRRKLISGDTDASALYFATLNRMMYPPATS